MKIKLKTSISPENLLRFRCIASVDTINIFSKFYCCCAVREGSTEDLAEKRAYRAICDEIESIKNEKVKKVAYDGM